jgi:hypothetical protein
VYHNGSSATSASLERILKSLSETRECYNYCFFQARKISLHVTIKVSGIVKMESIQISSIHAANDAATVKQDCVQRKPLINNTG